MDPKRLTSLWILLSVWLATGLFDIDLAKAHASSTVIADRILVDKSERKLYLLHNGNIIEEYKVALGRVPRGHKQFSGDGKTPEGVYYIQGRNDQSRFHRALLISYPNHNDRRNAAVLGKPAGGEIMIHGVPEELAHWGEDHFMFNWTEGCIAVLNDEIDEIWQVVQIGTPIEIRP